MPSPISFDNRYVRLPARFYHRQPAVPVSAPGLIRANRTLATELGIDPHWLESAEGVAMAAGNRVPQGAEPLAAAYAGHQFGHWNPQLGDGRALLLGEVVDAQGRRFDVQLKGSGPTPWSRGGDGRAPLGPVLREYLVSEAMAAYGVPTTRALAAVTTGEQVYRDGPMPGAVLVRIAQSHIRIGTFAYFAARDDDEALRLLSQHVIERHYPHATAASNPIRCLLDGVIARQASLVAHWQALGFIHGVMNTDNMLLSGETIDYGPCAFMDAFDPQAVYSAIDRHGRYAYDQQPDIAYWNLQRLAEALLPLLDTDEASAHQQAVDALAAYPGLYATAYRQRMLDKLGISPLPEKEKEDDALLADFLTLLADESLDFTLSFRYLTALAGTGTPDSTIQKLIRFPAAMDPWLARWQARMAREKRPAAQRQQRMQACNPVLIPRNHQIESVIQAALEEDDLQPFHRLADALLLPFAETALHTPYALPPRPDQRVKQTFCGT